ncbi:hypothetical protein D5R93_05740 [Actinomyces lilanjuaniae]|uniref:Rho termination factor N-terminal domain-containing protein n=1 Tax=Actinomyces lilanjuaniae TaxID=2321394 RepID=A0ABN5PRJ7_9ACTO|nr:hypothetical protein [Actinomyces lilanjuaniae]AYD89674.1 hypothetical protein D5R93_05740 [Actinomyces lilanjuaniae]
MGRRLATHVVVHGRAGSLMLPAGTVPSAQEAALITNPACWEPGAHEDTSTPPATPGTLPVPDQSWTVADLRAWAAHQGVSLGAARSKADILMVLADEADRDPEEDDDGDAGPG